MQKYDSTSVLLSHVIWLFGRRIGKRLDVPCTSRWFQVKVILRTSPKQNYSTLQQWLVQLGIVRRSADTSHVPPDSFLLNICLHSTFNINTISTFEMNIFTSARVTQATRATRQIFSYNFNRRTNSSFVLTKSSRSIFKAAKYRLHYSLSSLRG